VQELEVKRLVTELTGYPVVCAHELSGDLGIYERTVTAVLNARLIPLITHLIDAVKQALQNRGIHAPVMVVKGDGSLMFESAAREKPVETILSGPAASLIGAAALSGITDGVVVDMGGTTTDIAVLNGGRPAVRDEGARVGGWLTRVKAADITTIGLGGDSIIRVSKDGVLTIGPQKVFPLSWIVSQHPFLLEELHTVERSAFSPLDAQPTSVLVLIREPAGMLLTDTERGILEQIREGPHTLCHVSDKLGVNVNLMGWERLVQIGAVHRAGCTPTDILHVTGRFTEWDQSAAAIGVRVMADRYGTTVDDFIGEVLRMISYRLFTLIVEELVLNSMERGRGKMVLQESEESSFFLQRMFEAHESKEGNIRFSAQASLPVIGVGAPARAYFPDVLKRMQGRLVVPGDADVANAVGTVNGRVIERVRLLIKPGHSGGFFVFTPEGRKIFTVFDESAEYCERYGREYVRNRARKAGASNIAVSLQRRDRYGSLSGSSGKKDDEARVFIESEIQCEAEGVPW
jgi:N-methylhydantoinase A/oxoprolinase/acetone carboxylase beta subunit